MLFLFAIRQSKSQNVLLFYDQYHTILIHNYNECEGHDFHDTLKVGDDENSNKT